MFDDLDEIRRHAATCILQGADQWRSPFHTPVVATSDADLRVMVLRGFDPDTWTLRFNTDARAPKVASVGEGASVGVLFYDAHSKLQLRGRGEGWIERDGPPVDEAWEAATNFARRCYLGEAPGETSDTPTSGLPEWAEGIEPDEAQLIPARENFALLLLRLETLDVLHLAHTGHRRALFELPDGEGRWIAP